MKKRYKMLAAGFIVGMTIIGCRPVYAAMDMENTSPFAGISVSFNNYFAGSMEPEKELAESLGIESVDPAVMVRASVFETGKAGEAALAGQLPETPAVQADARPEEKPHFTVFSAAQAGSAENLLNNAPAVPSSGSAYENIAVSQVSDYVNVRTEPDTGSVVVGKIYNNCAATILDTVTGEGGRWYKIQSGTITGYIKAQYFITGGEAETLARQIGKEFATINTASLRLREKPSLTGNTLTMLSEGVEYVVLGREGDFYQVAIDNDLVGYVAQTYVKTAVRFEQAVSLEEEAVKEKQDERRREDARAAIQALEEVRRVEAKKDDTSIAAETSGGQAPPDADTGTSAASGAQVGTSVYIEPNPVSVTYETVAAPASAASAASAAAASGSGYLQQTPIGPGVGSASGIGSTAVISATRTAIVAYAMQFLGNPYVFGGTSLTDGADCSGFTQAVFANFDIVIGRSSRDQAAKGRTISMDAVQPGDLLFYASGDYINHVAIYIGGGQVIHASNSTTGIIISPYNYRTPCRAATFLN